MRESNTERGLTRSCFSCASCVLSLHIFSTYSGAQLICAKSKLRLLAIVKYALFMRINDELTINANMLWGCAELNKNFRNSSSQLENSIGDRNRL